VLLGSDQLLRSETGSRVSRHLSDAPTLSSDLLLYRSVHCDAPSLILSDNAVYCHTPAFALPDCAANRHPLTLPLPDYAAYRHTLALSNAHSDHV
jgi:hypothetical protein